MLKMIAKLPLPRHGRARMRDRRKRLQLRHWRCCLYRRHWQMRRIRDLILLVVFFVLFFPRHTPLASQFFRTTDKSTAQRGTCMSKRWHFASTTARYHSFNGGPRLEKRDLTMTGLEDSYRRSGPQNVRRQSPVNSVFPKVALESICSALQECPGSLGSGATNTFLAYRMSLPLTGYVGRYLLSANRRLRSPIWSAGHPSIARVHRAADPSCHSKSHSFRGLNAPSCTFRTLLSTAIRFHPKNAIRRQKKTSHGGISQNPIWTSLTPVLRFSIPLFSEPSFPCLLC